MLINNCMFVWANTQTMLFAIITYYYSWTEMETTVVYISGSIGFFSCDILLNLFLNEHFSCLIVFVYVCDLFMFWLIVFIVMLLSITVVITRSDIQ